MAQVARCCRELGVRFGGLDAPVWGDVVVDPATMLTIAELLGPSVVAALRKADYATKLKRSARRATGARPPWWYRKWIGTEGAWSELVLFSDQCFDNLLTQARDRNAEVSFRKRTDVDLQRLVQHSMDHFLEALDQVIRDKVTDFRSRTEHQAILDQTIQIRDQTTKILDVVTRGGEAKADLLLTVPYVVGSVLNRSDVPLAVVQDLLSRVQVDDPQQALNDLARTLPDWLTNASAAATVAVGEWCRAFNLDDSAILCFEAAAERGFLPDELRFKAAMSALHAPRVDDFHRLVEMLDMAADTVWLTVARAVHAANPDAVVAAIDDAHTESHPTLLLYKATGLIDIGRSNDALRLLRAGKIEHGRMSAIRLVIAQALLNRAGDTSSTSPSGDRVEALHEAVAGRDLVRVWGGRSAPYVLLAMRAAGELGDYGRLRSLGTPEPEGEATADEAADDQVKFETTRATMLADDVDLDLSSLKLPAFETAYLAAFRWAAGDPTDVFFELWDLSESEDQKVQAWLLAADAGVDPLPGASELAGRDDVVADMVRANVAFVGGDTDGALRILREHPGHKMCALRVAHLLDTLNRPQEAVAQYRLVARVARDPSVLRRAAELSTELRDFDAVVELTAAMLAGLPPGMSDRRRIHQLRARAFEGLHSWSELDVAARQWDAELNDDEAKWLRAWALYRQGFAREAWDLLAKASLMPDTEQTARLWVDLCAKYTESATPVADLLDVQQRFPVSEPVANLVIAGVFDLGTRGAREADLPVDVQVRFNQLVQEHAGEPGSDAAIVRFEVPEDPAEFLDAQAPALKARHEAFADLVRQALFGEIPYGLLASATGHSYALTLVQKAAGAFIVGEGTIPSAEIEAAAAAFNLTVVADLSALATRVMSPATMTRISSLFAEVRVVSAHVADASAAASDRSLHASMSLEWDPSLGRVVPRETDQEELARTRERSRALATLVTQLSVVSWETVRHLVPEKHSVHDDPDLAWLAAVDYAKATELPLWVDDLALRRMAASEGIPVFGTLAAAEVARSRGVISELELGSLHSALLDEWCFDVPLTYESVLRRGVLSNWKPQPLLQALCRPYVWQLGDTSPGDFASELLLSVAHLNPTMLPAWSSCVAQGVVRLLGHERVPELGESIVALTAIFASLDPEITAETLRCVRVRLAEIGVEVSASRTAKVLVSQLESRTSTDVAASLAVGAVGGFTEQDRTDAVTAILATG